VKSVGILLIGLSLLSLAMTSVISDLIPALYSAGGFNRSYQISIFVYIVIGLVFLLGLYSLFNKRSINHQ